MQLELAPTVTGLWTMPKQEVTQEQERKPRVLRCLAMLTSQPLTPCLTCLLHHDGCMRPSQ